MNILVTGVSGFIGRNLLAYMESLQFEKQHNVILLSKSFNSNKYKCIQYETSDYEITTDLFRKNNIKHIDTLLHLGAFIPKHTKDANDVGKAFLNIKNTKSLIDNLPSLPGKIVFTSTLDVYGKKNSKINEKSSTEPTTLYGYSKLFCEKMLCTFGEENNIITNILRLGHIYGNGEEAYQKIIPTTIRNVLNNTAPKIFGTGMEKRAFLHVLDCCRLILSALDLTESIGIINVASDNIITIKKLVAIIIKISTKPITPIFVSQNFTPNNIISDNRKMKKYLGNENISLEDGLKREYEYFSKLIR
jgi:nucleoside-diphosphate-sugar epimerase